MAKTEYAVNLYYRGKVDFGFEEELVDSLTDKQKELFDGTEYSFISQERTLFFYTYTEEEAEELKKTLIENAKELGYKVEVEIENYSDEEE